MPAYGRRNVRRSVKTDRLMPVCPVQSRFTPLRSAVLNAVEAAEAWSLTGDVLGVLRQDRVPLDQRLAAQFITCFGRLGKLASAEAIFEVLSYPSRIGSTSYKPNFTTPLKSSTIC